MSGGQEFGHDMMRRIQQGDLGALEALYDRHGTAVYSLALRILRNPPDAEEVVQDTFLQVWRQARSFDASRAGVAGWLLMIARSRAIDRLRRTSRWLRREQGLGVGDAEPASLETLSSDDALIQDETARGLRDHVDALPPFQRVPLELAFFLGFTHSEIAAVMSQPLGTIKTRIRLGLQRIREGIDEGRVGSRAQEPSPFTEALAEYLARSPLLTRSSVRLEGVHVLVVDDDEETVDLTTTMLQSAGAKVGTANSTAEALAFLQLEWPDVILADISMPENDGYVLIRRARSLADENRRPLTAAAFTARGRLEHARALGAGFAAVVGKPVQPHKLLEIVARLADKAA